MPRRKRPASMPVPSESVRSSTLRVVPVSFSAWLAVQKWPQRFLVVLVPVLLVALGVLLGDLVAEEVLPSPASARDRFLLWRAEVQALVDRVRLEAWPTALAHFNESAVGRFLAELPVWDALSFGSRERPGLVWRARGARVKHPVALIPGFITTQLELWEGTECAADHFHRNVWGGLSMVELMLRNAPCWAEHMTLCPLSGFDPPSIRVRAVEGLHGLDYLFPGYWVWGRLIANLADLGYDPSSLYAATYDWRLTPAHSESRDGTLTKLKGEKAVLVSHSMSGPLTLYFLQWVYAHDPTWTERYVHAYINIGGALLGSPKAVAALLSGEMKDTVEFEFVRAYIADNFISPRTRLNMFRSWYSIGNLLPKGGDAVWGSHSGSPDAPDTDMHHLLTFPHHFEEALDFLFERLEHDEEPTAAHVGRNLRRWYSWSAHTQGDLRDVPEAQWTNPLATALPEAPSMRIYCLYGVGKPTERAYAYRDQQDADTVSWRCVQSVKSVFAALTLVRAPPLAGIRYSLDTRVGTGVRVGEGDGTVPLVSLGYMCVRGWQHQRYNPAGVRVTTREYQHAPRLLDLRGGEETADHVDIMGNYDLISDVLAIVSGEGVDDEVVSDIAAIAARVDARLGLETACATAET